jgi:hypothetical protein
VHTHKTTFIQRRSLDAWPDFESAKKYLILAMSGGAIRSKAKRWRCTDDFHHRRQRDNALTTRAAENILDFAGEQIH